jgi:HPt (histidine-containing phosphotransfer) domain-containing protein
MTFVCILHLFIGIQKKQLAEKVDKMLEKQDSNCNGCKNMHSLVHALHGKQASAAITKI